MLQFTSSPRDALVNIVFLDKDGSIHFSDISDMKSVEDIDHFTKDSMNISESFRKSNSSLNEAAMEVFEMQKKMIDRTEDEIREEHMQNNSSLFNNLFFQPNFTTMVKNIRDNRFDFMDIFYPSFRYSNFEIKVASCIGGLYTNMLEANNPDGYNTSTWNYDINNDDDFRDMMMTEYNERVNWFTIREHDEDHIRYCFKLYMLTQKIITEKISSLEMLEKEEQEILHQWEPRVHKTYCLLKASKKSSYDYYMYCQSLHDLMWDPMDNPYDMTICCANVFKFIEEYFNDMNMNEESIIRKNDLFAYIFKDTMQNDRMFLLPGTAEFPIMNKFAIKLAMDNILHINEKDIPEYVDNLNRKYKEYGCSFTIPANHPYAKYAVSGKNPIPIVVSHILYDIHTPDSDMISEQVDMFRSIYYKNGVE